MLILTRKKDQGLYIGSAYVKVLGVNAQGRVTLGVEVPDTVPVRREELPEKETHRKGDV